MNSIDAEQGVCADAAALQERDTFTGAGWIKAIAPAKVNLHLAIGAHRADGYHEAVSIMHALALHDTVYLRMASAEGSAQGAQYSDDAVAAPGLPPVSVRMVGAGDVAAPVVPTGDNIATHAVHALACALADAGLDVPQRPVQIRIEKNIPAQGGLGGGSSDAAAVLAGLERLWNVAVPSALIDEVARSLGADVAFFLRGGCAYLDGAGDRFHHALTPRSGSVVLVKPTGGVSTSAAYRAFDQQPIAIDPEAAERALRAQDACDVEAFNNLAPAAESLMPELGAVRSWLESQQGVSSALLCGSGATTFGICATFSDACRIVADARARGLWARTTAFSAVRAAVC